jgi:Protein of unknown function (DUF2510)/Short C-terminal domain
MNAQAPAGWYPDGHGDERYWDGSAWTQQFRTPGGTDATSAATPSAKKDGAFSKLGAAVKKAAADKHAAKEELGRKQAEDGQAAGALVTSGVFGTSTVEIYDGGYVRVAAGQSKATQPASITKNTPYEKLRSIKFTQPSQGNTSGMTSPLEGAVGPAVARLMKGGAGLMKASVPGLAVAGLAHVAGQEGRKSFLTIASDKAIHTLTNQSHNGLISKSNKGHNEVGLALEVAGNSVLGVVGDAVHEPVLEPHPASEPQSVVVSQAAAGPTLAERLRELAGLHKDGILSDDEFAAAKATLLGKL